MHAAAMQYARLAALVRAVRRERRFRQVDVAARAHVSQQTVSRVEQGELDRLQLGTVTAIADSLGIVLEIGARWHGSRGDRLLDSAHATLVERVVKTLASAGWQTVIEYAFNRYGERGSVDVVGWHAGLSSLLVVEVKSQIVDVQDLTATLHRKVRIVPGELARERGWRARKLGTVLVLPAGSGPRDAVSRHAATFDSAFPGRTREVLAWLRAPDTDLRAIWFVRATPREGVTPVPSAARRIRRG